MLQVKGYICCKRLLKRILIQTRDAFPATKLRKEGFRKVFNVCIKSHFSNFEVRSRTPGHKNVLRWFLKRYKWSLSPSNLRNSVSLRQQNGWLLRVQHTLCVTGKLNSICQRKWEKWKINKWINKEINK